MTIQTIEPAAIGPDDNSTSYDDGYSDGELAAITRLSSRRVHARAAMADDYDPNYAQGLIDGYLNQIIAALAQNRRVA